MNVDLDWPTHRGATRRCVGPRGSKWDGGPVALGLPTGVYCPRLSSCVNDLTGYFNTLVVPWKVIPAVTS